MNYAIIFLDVKVLRHSLTLIYGFYSDQLNGYFKGIDLKVTNYYSVMSDGQMCIPWNWKTE